MRPILLETASNCSKVPELHQPTFKNFERDTGKKKNVQVERKTPETFQMGIVRIYRKISSKHPFLGK